MTGSYIDRTTLNREVDRLQRQITAAHAKLDGGQGWKKVSITVPVLSRTLTQTRASDEVHTRVRTVLARTFGGYSADIISGGYVMEDGSIANDRSVRYTSYTSEDVMTCDFTLKPLAADAAGKLDQETVMTTIEYLPPGSTVAFVDRGYVVNYD